MLRSHFTNSQIPKTFAGQLQLFADHGVIVSPHGAGLMNVMFMPPYSSVIEIFPYHFDHNLYPAASISSGLGYYPVHSYNGSDMWSRFAVCQALHLSPLSSP